MIGKIEQAEALYFAPKDIGESEGASCGRCMMFIGYPRGEGSCTVVEGSISGPHGICGLYVHGQHSGPEMEGKLSKKTAGYITNSPTHCGNCEYYDGDKRSGPCHKVQGTVEFHGCCNLWSKLEALRS